MRPSTRTRTVTRLPLVREAAFFVCSSSKKHCTEPLDDCVERPLVGACTAYEEERRQEQQLRAEGTLQPSPVHACPSRNGGVRGSVYDRTVLLRP